MPSADRPGRSCPLHYRYAPEVFRRPTELRADAIYVAGGVYGNPLALVRLTEMTAAESGDARFVYNGDFNWFNVDPASFEAVNMAVLEHVALRGNVETELATDDESQGCGCGYPERVADEVVERSNQVMDALRRTAAGFPQLRRRLGNLPMHLTAEVGGVRIAVVHGDAESLAGWSFSHEALSERVDEERLAQWFAAADVQIFASTHTCLPVVKRVTRPHAPALIVNNGSVGMPNIAGTAYGLVTRLATSPTALETCLSLRCGGLYVDLLKVEYDHSRWVEMFQRNWPSGSPAHASYFKRILLGPEFRGPIQL